MSRTLHLVPAAALLLLGCAGADLPRVPGEADWREVGVVLELGGEGDWDHYLAGASTPSTLLVRDGVYYLYYGGADGLRSTDGGPRHRAIGVATSADGTTFTKQPGPVVAWWPNGWEEEGANSAGVALDEDGAVLMFYGAATMVDRDRISADGRLARSTDGVAFADQGVIVLDHDDPGLYGHGDEIFPLAAYRHGSTWYVFYVPNGVPQARDLAVAWGPSPRRLEHSARVIDGNDARPVHIAANVVPWGRDRVLLFVQRGWKPDVTVEVYAPRADRPDRPGRPVARWDGPDWREGTRFFTVFLDVAQRRWLLFRHEWSRGIVLHVAPYEP